MELNLTTPDAKPLIVGIDEAGRGPLAGPVIAGAVILDPKQPIKGLNDSKQLTESKRKQLFALIRERAIAWAVAKASVIEIDAINIFQATFLAMQRAVSRLKIVPEFGLIDGKYCPVFTFPVKAIINGDQLEPCISAASIVAKVIRDRLMIKLHEKYPQYGFAQHKGYTTQLHLAALSKYGPCRIHRRTFAPVRAASSPCTLSSASEREGIRI